MSILIEEAAPSDLDALVQLLADDPLGATRERVSENVDATYKRAFEAIAADPNHVLPVAREDGNVLGVLQLSFIPGLTYTGGWRAQIEGVRVAKSARGRGVGQALIRHAIERAEERGCVLVQLTTDARRPEAKRFYEKLGFNATHHGMKLRLD